MPGLGPLWRRLDDWTKLACLGAPNWTRESTIHCSFVYLTPQNVGPWQDRLGALKENGGEDLGFSDPVSYRGNS